MQGVQMQTLLRSVAFLSIPSQTGNPHATAYHTHTMRTEQSRATEAACLFQLMLLSSVMSVAHLAWLAEGWGALLGQPGEQSSL